MSPWTDAEPLRSLMPVIRGADCLRRSLVPSLLAARRTNEALANPEIELFEIAKVYLPQAGRACRDEELMLGITSGRDYFGRQRRDRSDSRRVESRRAAGGRRRRLALFDPAARVPT